MFTAGKRAIVSNAGFSVLNSYACKYLSKPRMRDLLQLSKSGFLYQVDSLVLIATAYTTLLSRVWVLKITK